MVDNKTTLAHIATRLRQARLDKALTQVEIAKKAGISENHYAQIERAEKNPTVTTLNSILDAIGVSSQDIFGK